MSLAADVSLAPGHPDARMLDDELLGEMHEPLGERYAAMLPKHPLAACGALPTAASLDALLATIHPAPARLT